MNLDSILNRKNLEIALGGGVILIFFSIILVFNIKLIEGLEPGECRNVDSLFLPRDLSNEYSIEKINESFVPYSDTNGFPETFNVELGDFQFELSLKYSF